MILLDGKKISEECVTSMKERVATLNFKPKLVIIRVGDRADSKSYVCSKVAYAEMVGIDAKVREFPDDVTEAELLSSITKFNKDDSVHGIIVQLPLPRHLNSKVIISKLDPKKDVDGLTDHNISKLVNNEPGIVPATPRGILTLLRSYNIEISGKHVVVLGRSRLVGKSVSLLMLNQNATVTMCHSKTENLEGITKTADILIVAIGSQKFITKEHVREGQVVVDVGIGANDEGRLVGDVDFDAVKDIVVAISPVPGGVGPMTVVSLFENLLDTVEKI